ncbi:conserved hypothetical protein [Hyphomicrobiales bacterium]|jgi:hypothetical protein|nr:conserved hypothetical protein [Hyphomicrobiales bacterium]CAH1702636.1 hypothetical protein BOSEA1005_30508 [Hyphomicrobiales bacterium]CAI0346825.1 conserved hypothetical protein [Hyphomicrobiales bacterium]
MSLLTNPDGTVKVYATVDDQEEKILAAYNGVGSAMRGTKEIKAAGATNAVYYNLTHSTCPAWLKAAVRTDAAYCEGRAAAFEARAKALRAKAASLNTEAADHELAAQFWRLDIPSEDVPSGPKM